MRALISFEVLFSVSPATEGKGLNPGRKMRMFGKTIYSNMDLAKADAWAEELGKKFSKH
jgi:hypothetical protein